MCAAGDQCNILVGQRVEHQGIHGTVHYIGEVASQPGLWIGVEWDDPNRGKHNGSHNGVQYFNTSHPTSGSFVRPNKISTGISCVDAIRSRYGTVEGITDTIDTAVLMEIKKNFKASLLEMVGFEKVAKKQGQFESLKTVVLSNKQVNGPGEPGALGAMCPSIEELDLSHTLLDNWLTLADITRQLPRLQYLVISDNRLRTPDEDEACKQVDAFRNIRQLVMSNMGYCWSDILKCAVMWPNVRELLVHSNIIHHLESPKNGILSQLESLHLTNNPIENWDEVNKLGNISTLKTLHLVSTGLKTISFPGEKKTSLFPALLDLKLAENLIDNWDSISELNKLTSLTNLDVRSNPLVESKEECDGRAYQMIIGRVGNLKILNGSEITLGERRGAEYDYMKRYGPEWLKAQKSPVLLQEFCRAHPRYTSLVQKYGAYESDELVSLSAALKSHMVSVTIFSPDHPTKPRFTKRLPNTMSVQKLSGLAQKLLDTGGKIPTLSAISRKAPGAEIILDKDLQTLSFYSIEDGDSICVRW